MLTNWHLTMKTPHRYIPTKQLSGLFMTNGSDHAGFTSGVFSYLVLPASPGSSERGMWQRLRHQPYTWELVELATFAELVASQLAIRKLTNLFNWPLYIAGKFEKNSSAAIMRLLFYFEISWTCTYWHCDTTTDYLTPAVHLCVGMSDLHFTQ